MLKGEWDIQVFTHFNREGVYSLETNIVKITVSYCIKTEVESNFEPSTWECFCAQVDTDWDAFLLNGAVLA